MTSLAHKDIDVSTNADKIKKIHILDNINSFKHKFDVITMFHVLEHIPYQIDTLKVLKSKLKNKGKIIIEVPHAEDFLILQGLKRKALSWMVLIISW